MLLMIFCIIFTIITVALVIRALVCQSVISKLIDGQFHDTVKSLPGNVSMVFDPAYWDKWTVDDWLEDYKR